MDPITSAILAAISAGVLDGRVGQASSDLYAGLKTLLKQKYGGDNDLNKSLENFEKQPQSAASKEILEEKVLTAKAKDDLEILKAAQNLKAALEAQSDSAKAVARVNSFVGGNVTGNIIIGDHNKVIHPTNIPGTGSAPPLPQLMIGREDALRDLKTRLGIVPGGEVPAALQALTTVRGWPGVGKTAIAAALAHDPDVITAFPDGVLWASLGPQPNLFSQLAAWGRELGNKEVMKARTLEEAAAQLTALLRSKRRLLIVDDVWEPEHALPFKVGGRACATLITTRIPGVAQALAPTADDIYWLPVLTDEKALELLQKLAPVVVAENPKEALELVRELMGLPLALQVAGRLLNVEASQGFSLSDLLAELRAGAKLLKSEAPADLADLAHQTTPTVAALLQKSTQRLDAQTRQCFARLGVFAPNPASFDRVAMQAVWQVEDPKPIARALMQRGLLEYVPERKCYQMHALLHQYGQTLLTEKEATEARQKHFAFFQGFAKNYAGVNLSKQSKSKTQQFELLYPQMKQALVNFERVLGLSASKTEPDQLQQMIQLIDTLDQYWILHSQFADQAKWLEVAYNCADALKDALKQADFARRVGRVLSSQSRLEDALAWMDGCKTALGEDQSEEAQAIQALMYIHTASIEYQQGALEKAEKDCTCGIELVDKHNQLRIYAEGYNLLGAIQVTTNKLSVALEAFEKSLSAWKQAGDQYQIYCVEDNIRTAHYYLGDIAYVRKADEKSLQYWRQFPDRIELAIALSNRGLVHYIDKEYETAVELHNDAIRISELLGSPRVGALARCNLAWSYISLGKYDNAEALLNESLTILKKHGIMEHWIDAERCLAEVEIGRKNYTEAIKIAKTAMESAQEEGDPLEEGAALRVLGQAYHLNGNLKQAAVRLKKSLSLLRSKKYKYESFLTLQALNELYNDTGDPEKAQKEAKNAEALSREMGLHRSPETSSDTN